MYCFYWLCLLFLSFFFMLCCSHYIEASTLSLMLVSPFPSPFLNTYTYLPTPPLGQDVTQGQFWSAVLQVLNSEFSFSYTSCLTKAEEQSLPYYLPIAGGRIIGFIPLPRVSVLFEMQSRPGFELVPQCPFPTTITITPRAPPLFLTHIVCQRNLWDVRLYGSSSGFLFSGPFV